MQPITISKVYHGSSILVINPPVVLTPVSQGSTYHGTVEDWGFMLWGADSLEELEADLIYQIVSTWRQYGVKKDEKLSEAAKEVKEFLLSRITPYPLTAAVSLEIYHNCDKSKPAEVIPFGLGFPHLPLYCPLCGKKIDNLPDLTFDFELDQNMLKQ